MKLPGLLMSGILIDPFVYQPQAKTCIDVLNARGKSKYKTAMGLRFYLPSLKGAECVAGLVSLKDCTLSIRMGFVNDGVSGGGADAFSAILAWVIHDALFVLKNEHGKRAGFSYWAANRIYRKVRRAQGTNRLWAWGQGSILTAFGWVPRVRLIFRKDKLQEVGK